MPVLGVSVVISAIPGEIVKHFPYISYNNWYDQFFALVGEVFSPNKST